MPATVESLGIDRLSRDERLALVQKIWDTIAAEQVSTSLTDAQFQELSARVAQDDASPNDVIPWDEVKAQALARLRQS